MKLSFMQAPDLTTRRQSSDGKFFDDELLFALKAARDIDSFPAEFVPSIADLLRETHSQRVRNEAALTLADLRDPRGAEALVEVLRRPEVPKVAGTLIHAFDEMGAALPMDVLTSIVMHGSYEARAMAISMLEDGRISIMGPAIEAAARDAFAILAASDDIEGAEAAHAALGALDDLEREAR